MNALYNNTGEIIHRDNSLSCGVRGCFANSLFSTSCSHVILANGCSIVGSILAPSTDREEERRRNTGYILQFGTWEPLHLVLYSLLFCLLTESPVGSLQLSTLYSLLPVISDTF